MNRSMESSPRRIARAAGVFYVITFVTGILSLFVRGGLGTAAGFIAGASYVVVTVLLYFVFRPAGKGLSLLAAVVSLMGCAIGPLTMVHVVPFQISPLVFFGIYCTLIGILVFRSTFMPRWLGGLMLFAGLGWLTYLSSSLSKQLAPYNMFAGILGEAALTIVLLTVGVDVARWNEQAKGKT